MRVRGTVCAVAGNSGTAYRGRTLQVVLGRRVSVDLHLFRAMGATRYTRESDTQKYSFYLFQYGATWDRYN